MEERTWIHAFTDGRDVRPTSAVHDLAELPDERIATVAGRYYAMDRDRRWERTNRALAAICLSEEAGAGHAVDAVRESYERGVTDEFIEPVVHSHRPRTYSVADDATFVNFRLHRARQNAEKLVAFGRYLSS